MLFHPKQKELTGLDLLIAFAGENQLHPLFDHNDSMGRRAGNRHSRKPDYRVKDGTLQGSHPVARLLSMKYIVIR